MNGAAISSYGFKGNDYDTVVNHKDLVENFGCGIVVIDEFDKLCKPAYDNHGANISEAIQESFLKLMEDEEINTDYGYVSTERTLFILMGAFSGIEELLPSTEPPKVGFGLRPKMPNTRQPLNHKDLKACGCSEQLLGRCLAIVNLTRPDKSVYRHIAKESLTECIQTFGVPVQTTDDLLDSIIEKAQ